MYSLEPPLYFLLNKAMRTYNHAYLNMLGPFARAISEVLAGAEKRRNDKVKMGQDMRNTEMFRQLGTMCGSMVVFRGVLFPTKHIFEFQNQIGKRRWTPEDIQAGKDGNMAGYVHLPGVTSTSESFKVALDFARAPSNKSLDCANLHSVLFVICL